MIIKIKYSNSELIELKYNLNTIYFVNISTKTGRIESTGNLRHPVTRPVQKICLRHSALSSRYSIFKVKFPSELTVKSFRSSPLPRSFLPISIGSNVALLCSLEREIDLLLGIRQRSRQRKANARKINQLN